MPRQILVTSALPYANGSIHLGHMVEHVQTDIWVRFQRMRGHEIWYVCADDTHGTPVMLAAEKAGVTPEALIDQARAEHLRDFTGFGISYDLYYSTHTDETRAYAEQIYTRLQAAGLIDIRPVEQFYDPQRQMFLPDRFVKGECPRCHAADQYGDSCEVCGASYSPTELIKPYSAVTGATPERRSSDHHFFRLGECAAFLQAWTRSGTIPEAAANKLAEWFEAGLSDWDISRDAPYFGFGIPGAPGKFFYVWLDAPIGYMGTFHHLAAQRALNFDDWWGPQSRAELHHFIGKDILYFHSLFWPAMLARSGYRTPTRLHVHGFLTVNGQKMSKSRGSFITAADYLAHLNPEYLRYYYAAKLNAGVDDLDLNLDDFSARVNSDLVGKYVNLASRTAGFIRKRFAGRTAAALHAPAEALVARFRAAADDIARAYEDGEFSRAMREIMALADLANQYVDANKPWEIAKDAARGADLQAVCTACLELFRLLTLYLKPVLPQIATQVEALLRIAPLDWAALDRPVLDQEIDEYRHLVTRVEPAHIAAMLQASAAPAAAAEAPPAGIAPVARAGIAGAAQPARSAPEEVARPAIPPIADTIGIDDFSRIDLRVARIIKAEAVPEADKLLRLTVDLGVETRTVFAGIKSAYAPEQLEGRLTVVVANLAPRKMRFGESQGMVLAAGDGTGLYILAPDSGAQPGMRIK
ncbi:MAG: methionine--tRNA ligase [Pseudomonadota bacterium]|nr:methionine--tRNA ligase [Pseudomonadota bacterium]